MQISGLGLWHTGPEESKVRETDLNGSEQALVIRSLYSLISSGTEKLVSTGKAAQHGDRMAVPHMQGSFELPIFYGYSLVGRVDMPGHGLHGEVVHLMHPHSEVAIASEADLMVIPGEVPPRRAGLLSNLGTAVTGVWDSGVRVGDRVLVVGYGLIGALISRILARIPGVQVHVVEGAENRRALATEHDFKVVEPSGDYDVLFNCSTSGSGLQLCIDHGGMEAKIIEMSWYGNSDVEVSLGGRFHRNRLQIISSQVSQIPSFQQLRWSRKRRQRLVMDLLHEDDFDILLNLEVSLREAPTYFNRLRNGTTRSLGCLIKYD